MGFDIGLTWPYSDGDAMERNRRVRDALCQRFPQLEEFDINHDLVAERTNIKRDEALHDWCQFELIDNQEAFAGVIITIWLKSIYLEISSTPKSTCADEIAKVQPIIDFLQGYGYVLDDAETLLEEYEKQKVRAQTVDSIVHQHHT